MNDKPLYLIVGKSGTGKDTFVNLACYMWSMKKAMTATTRPKRSDDEDSHLFVDDEWFDRNKDDLVAYLSYDGYRYGCPRSEALEADFCIVDPQGAFDIKQNLPERECVAIKLEAPLDLRAERLFKRNGDEKSCMQRLNQDLETFGADMWDTAKTTEEFLGCGPFPKLKYDYVVYNCMPFEDLVNICRKYEDFDQFLSEYGCNS